MNREIKFRAWDKEMKRMIYINNSCDMHDTLVFFDGVAKYHNLQTGDGIDFPLMQYTGIKDKNNKEIYEGDIVVSDSGNKYKVIYDDTRFIRVSGALAGETMNTYNVGICYIDSCYKDGSSRIKVIGNIYENKEMLKDE